MTEVSNDRPTVAIAGVGRSYRTRDRQVVLILEPTNDETYPWYGEYDVPNENDKYGGFWYCADGHLFADPRYRPHPLDLVAEVV